MAIVKMKHLSLTVVRSQKEALLKELVKYGCVQIEEIGDKVKESEIESLLNAESSNISTLKSQYSTLINAVELLDKYAPQKKKFLSAKPELDTETFLDPEGLQGAVSFAQTIDSYDARIKRISAEESRQMSIVESLQPWLELGMRLNCTGTDYAAVILGAMPLKTSLSEVEDVILKVTEEAELFKISEDRLENYVAIVCAKEALPEIQECLREYAFSPVSFSGMEGTPKECLREAEETLSSLALEKNSCEEAIKAEAVRRDTLKLAADKMSVKISMAEAEEKLYGTESSVVMEGWMPSESEEELESVFNSFDCAWETEDPVEEEYPDVPVKLKNNKFTNALNMITNMYSLPAYGTVDPNPLMAPFFILFYGLMMADMGYGLIMIIAAVVAIKKIKPRKGSLSFCQLLLYGGISTFIMGIFTGGFFGDAPQQFVKLINPESTWEGLPALFNPLNDSLYVLIGALILGVIHLNAGMVISAVEKCKHGQVADMVFYEGSLWVILIGIIMMVLGVGKIAGVPVVLVIGILMLFYGAMKDKKGIGKVTAIFSAIYNEATGWFGDILSYARIMALMLAGSVIATVFNTIGAITGNVFLFILIFLIGHALNFGLNLLGCYVHDLRLQCLEFFGKFYQDGGKPFTPLEINSKYYNVKE